MSISRTAPRWLARLALDASTNTPDAMFEVPQNIAILLGLANAKTTVYIMCAAEITALAITRLHTTGEIPLQPNGRIYGDISPLTEDN